MNIKADINEVIAFISDVVQKEDFVTQAVLGSMVEEKFNLAPSTARIKVAEALGFLRGQGRVVMKKVSVKRNATSIISWNR